MIKLSQKLRLNFKMSEEEDIHMKFSREHWGKAGKQAG